jgi:ABC-type iron transport system FetAB ATPase subunit
VLILVALGTVSSVVICTLAAAHSAFDPAAVLKPEYFVRNRKRGFLGLLLVGFSWIGNLDGSTSSGVKHVSPEVPHSVVRSSTISIHSTFTCFDDAPFFLEVSELSLFEKSNREEPGGVSRDALSLRVREGEVLMIEGEDALLKSAIFSTLAGLRPPYGGGLHLHGKSVFDVVSSDWRKDVLLLPTGNPKISGTPMFFLRRISGFHTHISNNQIEEQDYFRHMIDEVSDHLFGWGLHIDYVNKDWNALSNEEGYLVLLAFALATRPKVLLLDFGGILSPLSRNGVDESIQKFVREERGAVLLLSNSESW